MKLTILTLVAAIGIATGILIVGKIYNPKPGQGALTIFKDEVKVHQILEMDSSLGSYIVLMRNMGIMHEKSSLVIYATDNFCIAKDSIGYFPAVYRGGKMAPGVKKVYLPLREGVIFADRSSEKKGLQGIVETAVSTAKQALSPSVSAVSSVSVGSFPKTLRYGAGWGEFASARPYVTLLQERLGIRPTGLYDQVTVNAVTNLQKKKGLTVDGIAGSGVKNVLGIQ
jgi:hypothetical protein